jgi:peptidoglycan hydrolase-like protein with peptidoglycan-binding domain
MIMFIGVVEAFARVVAEVVKGQASAVLPLRSYRKRGLGIYSGQADGILGPDTRRAIEAYQVKNKLPVTGQPDQGLNALLGIF